MDVAFSDRVSLEGWYSDRKSTRLNSSHSQISYAVFCLKKKKTAPTLPNTFAIRPWYKPLPRDGQYRATARSGASLDGVTGIVAASRHHRSVTVSLDV